MLSKKDFYNYLIKTNCEVLPFEGINTTANQVEIINKLHPERKFYLSTPFNEKAMSPKLIELACLRLGIELPPHYQ